MTADALDVVKRAALAIFAIAERETLESLTRRESAAADKLIGQAARAILRATDGAREGRRDADRLRQQEVEIMEGMYCGICVEFDDGNGPQTIMIGAEKGMINARWRVDHLAAAFMSATGDAMNSDGFPLGDNGEDGVPSGMWVPVVDVKRFFFVAGPENKTFYEASVNPEKTNWTGSTPEDRKRWFEGMASTAREMADLADDAAQATETASPREHYRRLRYLNTFVQSLTGYLSGEGGHPVDE